MQQEQTKSTKRGLKAWQLDRAMKMAYRRVCEREGRKIDGRSLSGPPRVPQDHRRDVRQDRGGCIVTQEQTHTPGPWMLGENTPSELDQPITRTARKAA
jgi:hypothetical protein